MNLLLIEAHELDRDGRLVLKDRRAEHLLQVLRVLPGEQVRAGILGGGQGKATIEAVVRQDKKSFAVTLKAEIATTMPQRPQIDLILGLPRPAVLHRVLQHAAAIGVDRLDLINAWKVPKSYFQSPALAAEAIRRHLLLGLEQGQRTWLPEVRLNPLLVPFAEALGESPGAQMRLLAHPGGRPIEEAFEAEDLPTDAPTNSPEDLPDASSSGRIMLAIGPEGGWLDREVETFEAVGFQSVSLGPWILRSEAAVTAALAQISVLRRLSDRRDARLC